MSEFSARPVRYIVPDRDYQPPAPAYRRPGSDHSYLPHSVTAAPARQETNPMTTTNDATAAPAATFDNASASARRSLILAELQNGPKGGLSRAELKDRLGCLDGAVLDKTLWYMRERNHLIERTDEGCYRLPVAEDAPPVAAEPVPLNASQPSSLTSVATPRIAITSDGSLLLWLADDPKPVEMRRPVTKLLYRVLQLNQELIA